MRDEPWQDMGFKCRPKSGALFQWFRPLWRVRLERAVLSEFLCLFTAAHVTAGIALIADIEDIVGIYVLGPDGKSELWRTLGFSSADEASRSLGASIATYVNAGPHDWLELLPARVGALDVQDRSLRAKLVSGAICVAQNAQAMVLQLRMRT